MDFQSKLTLFKACYYQYYEGERNDVIAARSGSDAIAKRLDERQNLDWGGIKFTDDLTYAYSRKTGVRVTYDYVVADATPDTYDSIIDEGVVALRDVIAGLEADGYDVEVYMPFVFTRVVIDPVSFEGVLNLEAMIVKSKDGEPA